MEKLTGYQTLTPAYGRDYKKGKDAEKDFLEGKDFILHSPFFEGYCSIKDFAPGAVANIRYNKQLRIFPVKVK